MRRFTLFLTWCLVAGWLASTASATLLVYEPFGYTFTTPVGTAIQGQVNSGNGLTWLRAGVANPPSINVASGSLAVPPSLSPTVGNSASIPGVGNGSGSTVRLALGQTVSSGTIYYSFALKIDALTGSNSTTGGFFIGLNNSGNVSQTGNPSVAAPRVQARIDPLDATKYQLGIFSNVSATSGASSWVLSSLGVGETHFIVAAYTFNTGSTTDDVASIWIDPGSLGAGSAPTATNTATGNDIASPGAASILLRQSPAPFLTLDELRIGTAWADVTPIVPEPGAFLFLLVSGGLVAARKWVVKPFVRQGKKVE